MPAPAVYIFAIAGTIAAGFAFKEYVYEPHIAPKLEQWATEFIAKREARRRQRAGAIPISVSHRTDEDLSSRRRSKLSDSDDEGVEMRQSIELENLIAKEVREWRSEVNRSQTRGLRHRNNAGPSGSRHALDESINRIPFVPMSPTHIIFDPSLPSTPSSTVPSAGASPSVRISTLHGTVSESTLRSPPPGEVPGRLPTPDLTSIASSPGATHLQTLSPAYIPSLSQTYPLELDHEHGLELLSAPSSRPDSPFSNFSHPLSGQETAQSSSNYYSFSSPNITPNIMSPNLMSPEARPPSRSLSDLDFLSDMDDHDPLSPRSFSSDAISAFDEPHLDDGTRSDASGSSWASTGAINR